MKSLHLLATLLLAISCAQPETKEEPATAETPAPAAATVTYPYTMRYSSDFSMDSPEYAQIVMEMWKQFDNNTLDAGLKYFADSVTIQFPDGTRMHNTRDSVMAMTKQWRSQFTKLWSEVDGIMPVKEGKSGDRWVCVWGEEYREDAKGKRDSSLLHELWAFNKEGKITFMQQYAGKD